MAHVNKQFKPLSEKDLKRQEEAERKSNRSHARFHSDEEAKAHLLGRGQPSKRDQERESRRLMRQAGLID